MKSQFSFQQDNCTIHKSKIVKEYMEKHKFQTIMWPSRSSDLNMVKDVWKTISDLVYDGPPLVNTDNLLKKIIDVIYLINYTKRQNILDLYESIRNKLCKVLVTNGNLYNG